MKGTDGSYGVWDNIPKNPDGITNKIQEESELDKKYKFFANPFGVRSEDEEKSTSWLNQRRLTGRLRFTKPKGISDTGKMDHHNHIHFEDEEQVTCSKQFQDYCAMTSLHGYSYISEPKRSYAERYVCNLRS